MCFPNVIIAGAPKCATGSLYNWLLDHPDVAGSDSKETFYLMDQGHPLLNKDTNFHVDGLEGYNALFKDCDHKKVILEATTHYIYQRTPIHVLSKMRPQPRIIVILRKPSQRIYSSFRYGQHVTARIAQNLSFSQFVDSIISGSESFIDTHVTCDVSLVMQEIRYSQYADFITGWLTSFRKENVHICLFEELVRGKAESMKRICQFLDIDDHPYHDYWFIHRNKTPILRCPRLHSELIRFSHFVRESPIKSFLKTVYLLLQSRSGTLSDEDIKTLKALDDYFIPYNRELKSVTGLDLTDWYEKT